METVKTVFLALTICGSVLGIGLITAAFATDYWIVAKPSLSFSGDDNDTVYGGDVNFGLFRGKSVLNYNGERIADIDVKEYAMNGTFDSAKWVSTIVMAGLGIVWGLIALAFSCFNVFGRPIETITGPVGLYLWNAFACLFTLLSVVVFAVLYSQDLSQNVLERAHLDVGWTSVDSAWPGFSFWLVVGAAFVFSLNILLVLCSGVRLRMPHYSSSATKELDGVMMY